MVSSRILGRKLGNQLESIILQLAVQHNHATSCTVSTTQVVEEMSREAYCGVAQ